MRLLAVMACVTAQSCGRVGFDVTDGATPFRAIETVVDQFSTTSTTFVDVPGATLTIPASPGQPWLVLVSATLQSSSFDEVGAEARYLVDGVEAGMGGTQNSVADRPGPWQHFHVVDGAEGPRSIAVQLRDVPGSTAVIAQLHLVAMPLPAGADPQYLALDPIQQIVGSSPDPYTTFDLTPASPGDYLVLLLANAKAGGTAGADNNHIDWSGPQFTTPTLLYPRKPWQSTLFVRRMALGAGVTTIALHARSSGGTAQFRMARVLAVRTEAFPSFEFAADATRSISDQPVTTTTSSLVPSATCAGGCVVLASIELEDACAAPPTVERVAHFQIGSTERLIQHQINTCGFKASYGTVALETGVPSIVSTGFSAGNGLPLEHNESSIVVFGLD